MMRLLWDALFGETTATFHIRDSIDESVLRLSNLLQGKESPIATEKIAGNVSRNYVQLRFVRPWPWPRFWGNVLFVGRFEESATGSSLTGIFIAPLTDRVVSIAAMFAGSAISLVGIIRLTIGADVEHSSAEFLMAFPAMLLILAFQVASRLSHGRSDEEALRAAILNVLR
jgi:hypothetical protein